MTSCFWHTRLVFRQSLVESQPLLQEAELRQKTMTVMTNQLPEDPSAKTLGISCH
jgi:hypothetical protein